MITVINCLPPIGRQKFIIIVTIIIILLIINSFVLFIELFKVISRSLTRTSANKA